MQIRKEFMVTMARLEDLGACWLDLPEKPEKCKRDYCLRSPGTCERTTEAWLKGARNRWRQDTKEAKDRIVRTRKFLGPKGRPLHEIILAWPEDLPHSDLVWLANEMVTNDLINVYRMLSGGALEPAAFTNLIRLEYGLPLA